MSGAAYTLPAPMRWPRAFLLAATLLGCQEFLVQPVAAVAVAPSGPRLAPAKKPRAALSRHLRRRKGHPALLQRHARHRHGRSNNATVEDALEHLPVRLHQLFAQVSSGGDKAQFLKALNEVYGRAQAERDRLIFECGDRRAMAAAETSEARASLERTETALTRLQERMQGLRAGIDGSLAELQASRDAFEAKRTSCDAARKLQAQALKVLGDDLPKAQAIAATATKSCKYTGGTPVGLVECDLGEGAYVVTFKEAALRTSVAELSVLSGRLLALELERASRAQTPSGSGVGLLQVQRRRQLRGGARRHGRSHLKRLVLLQKRRVEALGRHTLRADMCEDLQPVPCPSFADYMDSFVGGVEDLADELKLRMGDEDANCRSDIDGLTASITRNKHLSDDDGVAFATAVAEQGELSTSHSMQRDQVRRLSQEVGHSAEQCQEQLGDATQAMCSAKVLAREMSLLAEGFLGSCEVTDWVATECNATCGAGGTQTLTRRVVHAEGKPVCPPLEMTRKCNVKPCPVDGVMGRWQEWSQCSRACGGGTRTRHRQVLRRPEHGGLPTAETMQQEQCNVQPCDQDCVLSDWTSWSNCSKACAQGHQARVRHVLRPALGDGTCPQESDAQRSESKPCNEEPCRVTPPMQCMSPLDVVFALDSSGSMGEAGFGAVKALIQNVVGRMTFVGTDGGSLVQVGAVKFAESVTQVQSLTSDSAAFLKSVNGIAWTPSSTNTGEALAVAEQMFEQRGRANTPPVVVVVTDGMPLSTYILRSEAARLKNQGVRLVFILVGDGISRKTAQAWASGPGPENVLRARTVAALKEAATATAVLATLCPTLA